MATPGGGSDSPVDLSEVEEQLRKEPYRFEFFRLFVSLERLVPDRKPVGRFTIPSEEVARPGAYPSLSFPPVRFSPSIGPKESRRLSL
jgi:predicted component of type VI protein secretion system